MPIKINTTHPDYNKMLPKWLRCKTVIAGEDAVKDAGTLYLPALSEQETGDYNAYKNRASFYAATSRTLEGLVGIAFRKNPEVVNWLNSKNALFDSVTTNKISFNVFAKKVFNKLIGTGRHGVLLDIGKEASATDYPFMIEYVAESIINYGTRINEETGKEEFILVVLEEQKLVQKQDNPYEWVTETQYRELFLDDLGNYAVRIWTMDKNTKEYVWETITNPTIKTKKLNYIPFVIFNSDGPGTATNLPPLLDMVNINLSHYRSSADLEHGRHFTALPTAWTAGFNTKATKLVIGSPYAWMAEDSSAKADFLEFTGSGLGAIERALEQKESQMAILGARMLEEPRSTVEATDTHRIRNAGEQSVLASMIGSLEMGFNMLLGWASEWVGIGTISNVVLFNKDFNTNTLTPQYLATMFTTMQSGGLSYESYFYNLKKGEIIPESRTMEEELDLISKNPLMLSTTVDLDEEPDNNNADDE